MMTVESCTIWIFSGQSGQLGRQQTITSQPSGGMTVIPEIPTLQCKLCPNTLPSAWRGLSLCLAAGKNPPLDNLDQVPSPLATPPKRKTTPFARPLGRGLCSPTVNVVWAWINFVIGDLLLRTGRVSPENHGTLPRIPHRNHRDQHNS